MLMFQSQSLDHRQNLIHNYLGFFFLSAAFLSAQVLPLAFLWAQLEQVPYEMKIWIRHAIYHCLLKSNISFHEGTITYYAPHLVLYHVNGDVFRYKGIAAEIGCNQFYNETKTADFYFSIFLLISTSFIPNFTRFY